IARFPLPGWYPSVHLPRLDVTVVPMRILNKRKRLKPQDTTDGTDEKRRLRGARRRGLRMIWVAPGAGFRANRSKSGAAALYRFSESARFPAHLPKPNRSSPRRNAP